VLLAQFYLWQQTVFTAFRITLFCNTAFHRLQEKHESLIPAMPVAGL
jgi:hypothetical protein